MHEKATFSGYSCWRSGLPGSDADDAEAMVPAGALSELGFAWAGRLLLRATATEGWPSGLRRTLGKRVCVKAYRGFESHSLRHDIRIRANIRAALGVGETVIVELDFTSGSRRARAVGAVVQPSAVGVHRIRRPLPLAGVVKPTGARAVAHKVRSAVREVQLPNPAASR